MPSLLLPHRWNGKRFELHFRDGTVLHYRPNRGDLQSIREVWIEEHYRLPHQESSQYEVLVDLGANIGLASLWLAKHYGFKKLLIVEPELSNLEVLRKNLRANGIEAFIFEAAVGPDDGSARFSVAGISNMGCLSDTGVEVKMLSMNTILKQLEENVNIDVVKLDIEGGEERLFSGNLEWLRRVGLIIAELHPGVCDTENVIRTVVQNGFRFVPGRGLIHVCDGDALMDTFRAT